MFISYANDQRGPQVLSLAERLRDDGIDARIDRYAAPPLEGWPTWCTRELKSAQRILTVWTERYRQRFDLQASQALERTIDWEMRLLREAIEGPEPGLQRVVPVVLTSADRQYIPPELANTRDYCLEDNYAALRLLLNPPWTSSPSAADVPLPRLHVQSEGASTEPRHGSMPKPATPALGVKRVLIVAIHRADLPRLEIGREVREITAALRTAKHVKYDVHILWGATDRDVRLALQRRNPHILHFCNGIPGPCGLRGADVR